MVNYLEIVTLCVSIILVIFHSHKMLNFTAKAKENYFCQCSIRISLFAILFIIKFNNTEIFVIIKGTLIIIELSKILDIPLNERNFSILIVSLPYNEVNIKTINKLFSSSPISTNFYKRKIVLDGISNLDIFRSFESQIPFVFVNFGSH